MSKSDPDSGLNVHDREDDIRRKLNKAFCPLEKEEEPVNPVLMLCKHIVLPRIKTLRIDRPEKFGGPLSFNHYEEITESYFSGKLHPMDLKKGVAEGLIEMLRPVWALMSDPEPIREVLRKLGKL
jgi:tyrosyl-tRNA synthetase